LDQGVAADMLMVITPQRTLAEPYWSALHRPDIPPGSQPELLTFGGLARRMLALFWPLIARPAGFVHYEDPPIFLTLETAQYTMAHVVGPLFVEGYFDSVTIDRNRLYSQVIDNLNKAAVVGFPYTEIGTRLKEAWGGASSQAHIYDDTQECADRFRRHCLEHNLLDYSLQMEVFSQCLWELPEYKTYRIAHTQHIIVDNLEEDTPVSHDLLSSWLPDLQSALLVYDHQAGYRRFLGADPEHALLLRDQCPNQVAFTQSFVISTGLDMLSNEIGQTLGRRLGPAISFRADELASAMQYQSTRFHPEMIAWTVDTISNLVKQQGVPPEEIVVLSPFLSGALRFALMNALTQQGIPVRSHRPSRGLREEPATHCLLTLACLAHRSWGIVPDAYDLAYCLMQAVAGMDPVRAHLLAQIVYRKGSVDFWLAPFDPIKLEVKKRITFELGDRYRRLREWLMAYGQESAMHLDHFLSRLFGELLSQPGFGFNQDMEKGEIAATLIESVRKFRWEIGPRLQREEKNLSLEYIRMIQEGVLAAQYLPKWRIQSQPAVLVSPATTYLMTNHPVRIQFWLDVGSRGWWERLYQPLTQPYVLSRSWRRGAVWTDTEEFEANQETLYRLCLGLLRRCRERVYFGVSELGEQGFEQKGALINTLQRVLRRSALRGEISHV
ncbi:MAG: hypothetical protein PHQ40_17850, partial [Anaerolineaceae bacterium]|nr:hypothetical protein [Anaerolineaceae bacterium]